MDKELQGHRDSSCNSRPRRGWQGGRLEPATYVVLCTLFVICIQAHVYRDVAFPQSRGCRVNTTNCYLILDLGYPRWLRMMPGCSHKGDTGKCPKRPTQRSENTRLAFSAPNVLFRKNRQTPVLFCFVFPCEIRILGPRWQPAQTLCRPNKIHLQAGFYLLAAIPNTDKIPRVKEETETLRQQPPGPLERNVSLVPPCSARTLCWPVRSHVGPLSGLHH